MPHGIPSPDSTNLVFLLLDTKAFRECFQAWVQAVSKQGPRDIVTLVGKTMRASVDEGQPAQHMVSAFSARNRLVLGQRAVDAKSNEITVLPELIKVLDLKGCIVTLDSMGCQREIAKRIVAKKADYVLAVIGNQPCLLKAIQGCFQKLDADPGSSAWSVELVASDIRSHWGIENLLHWALDVACNKDANRTRKGNGPECRENSRAAR